MAGAADRLTLQRGSFGPDGTAGEAASWVADRELAPLSFTTPRSPAIMIRVADEGSGDAESHLFAAIGRRRSNREPFSPDPVPADVRMRLVDAAHAEGAWLELLIGMTALSGFAQITQSADKVLRRDPAYQERLSMWTRTEAACDGIPVAAAARIGEPQDLLPQRAYSDRTRAPGRDFEPEPLIAILGSIGDTATDQINAGQALRLERWRAARAPVA